LGLIAGGDRPDRYFRRLMSSGRRLELWINLFGRERRGTADELANSVRERVFDELNRNGKLRSTGRSVNDSLNKTEENQESKSGLGKRS